MQGILEPLQEILTRLADLDVINKDSQTVKLYTRVWNNQIRYEEDGKLYDFPKPAAFVEIASPVQFTILGQGFRGADLAFRIHLSHEHYNSEGTFEQDLPIFQLRDKIIGWLTGWKLPGCYPLVSIGEEQDYDHANTYHYVVDFVCNFTDTKGSRLDDDKWNKFIFTTPPTDLEVDKELKSDIPGTGRRFGGATYIIPQR